MFPPLTYSILARRAWRGLARRQPWLNHAVAQVRGSVLLQRYLTIGVVQVLGFLLMLWIVGSASDFPPLN